MFIAKSIVQSLSEGNVDFSILFFTHFFSLFIVNLLSFFYFLMKVYRVVCYAKLTFDWLPMLNPYEWPFSLFTTLTRPYFQFWQKYFPTIKFGNSFIQVSSLIGIEVLNAVLYFCMRITQFFLSILELTKTLI